MSVQLKSILDQLEESKNKGKNFIKYYDLIDFLKGVITGVILLFIFTLLFV